MGAGQSSSSASGSNEGIHGSSARPYHPLIGPPIVLCDPRSFMASGNAASHYAQAGVSERGTVQLVETSAFKSLRRENAQRAGRRRNGKGEWGTVCAVDGSLTIENEEWDEFYGPPVRKERFIPCECPPPAVAGTATLHPTCTSAEGQTSQVRDSRGGPSSVGAVFASAVATKAAKERFLWRLARDAGDADGARRAAPSPLVSQPPLPLVSPAVPEGRGGTSAWQVGASTSQHATAAHSVTERESALMAVWAPTNAATVQPVGIRATSSFAAEAGSDGVSQSYASDQQKTEHLPGFIASATSSSPQPPAEGDARIYSEASTPQNI